MGGCYELGKCLVASPTAVLLHYDRRRLCNHAASHGSSSANHAATYAPSHSSTHSSTHSAAAATTSPATSSIRARRPIQLRSGCGEYLESRQEGVVLQGPRQGLPQSGRWMRPSWYHKSTLRLQRWIRKLDGRLERSEEELVLCTCRQGLPNSGWGVCLSREAADAALAPSSGMKHPCSFRLGQRSTAAAR